MGAQRFKRWWWVASAWMATAGGIRATAPEFYLIEPYLKVGVLIHFDMEEEHVLIRDGHIVGLVDFASAFAGAPGEEFTRLYGLRWKDPLFETLLEGYPAIELQQIEFFTFLHLHWRIPWHVAKGNRPEKIMLLTQLYRRLIGSPGR